MKKRPLAVVVIAIIYILTGALGFAYHVSELIGSFQYQTLLMELVRLIAVAIGLFMLGGQNWARWAAFAWMALHVVVGALHTWPQFAIHCLFCALIAGFLFWGRADLYFSAGRASD